MVLKLTAVKWSAVQLWKLFRQYYYWIVLAIIILPIIFSTIQVAVETDNLSYPFIRLGLHLSNADKIIYENVQILKDDPVKLIGMEKPTEGLWNKAVYYFHVLKVVWLFFGLVWLILFPFVIIYKLIKLQGSKGFQSSTSSNIIKTIWLGLLFVFIVNLVVTVYYLIEGSIAYNFPAEATLEYQTWIVVLTTLPFHGIGSLIHFLALHI